MDTLSAESEVESEATNITTVPQKDMAATSGSKTDKTVKSARTAGTRTGKKKRLSKADMQAQYDARLDRLEAKVDSKFDLILSFMNQNKERNALPRSDSAVTDNVPNGERRPQKQLIPLEANLDEDLGSPRISREHDIDLRSEISFQVNREERNSFDNANDFSDFDSVSNSGKSPVRDTEHNKSRIEVSGDRFLKHIVSNDSNNDIAQNNMSKTVAEKSDEGQVKRPNLLSKVFKDEVKKQESSVGLVLDQAQVEILEGSWRSSNPDRLTAYKEEYRSCFPLHESSEQFLTVPTLDDLLETMLSRTHGDKAVKNWDSHRSLFSQPHKAIEKLAYQGQMSSRMSIISILYIQQALASLLKGLEDGDIDKDEACQTIRDVFAMSTKSLDLTGRNGAFMHMIRRKVAAEDSGLTTLKDIRSKWQNLPLTGDGLFGSHLDNLLEKRKSQKKKISDLIPEFSRKRKSDFESRDNGSFNKVQKVNAASSSAITEKGTTSRFQRNQGDFKNGSNYSGGTKNDAKKTDNRSAATGKSSWGSFQRIPKKRSS